MFVFSNEYHDKNEEGILVNTIGMLIVLFAIVVVSMVTNENYRRQPSPGEMQNYN